MLKRVATKCEGHSGPGQDNDHMDLERGTPGRGLLLLEEPGRGPAWCPLGGSPAPTVPSNPSCPSGTVNVAFTSGH